MDSPRIYVQKALTSAGEKPELMEALSIDEGIPRESLRGLLLFYGLYDFETVLDTGFFQIDEMAHDFLGADPQVYRDRAEVASSIRLLDERFPPSLLVSGEEDLMHPETVAFEKALQRIGVEYETVYIEKSRHRRSAPPAPPCASSRSTVEGPLSEGLAPTTTGTWAGEKAATRRSSASGSCPSTSS